MVTTTGFYGSDHKSMQGGDYAANMPYGHDHCRDHRRLFSANTLYGRDHNIILQRLRCKAFGVVVTIDPSAVMSVKLIYVLSSFHTLFIAFYIHIHEKLITFPLKLVL